MVILRKWWFWAAVALVAAGVVYAFTRSDEKEKAAATALKTARVTRGNLLASITATGTVQPIWTVELKCKASGEIVVLPISDGNYVKKGDLICKLDQTTAKNNYEQAKADYDVAVAAEKLQEKQLAQIKELYGKKLVSDSDYDSAELAYEKARAQRISAAAALSTASDQLDDTQLRAPMDGIILKNYVYQGQVISSGVSSVSGGTTIALLGNLDTVYVVAEVDEVDIGKAKIGQTVKAVADAFPDEEFSGRVIKIAPLATVAQNVTTFEVTAQVNNAAHLLKSGMNANVQIMTAEAKNVLMVPNEAVKELMDVIQYFPEEEQKKYATLLGGGSRNRPGQAAGGEAGGGQQVIVMQGGSGGGGGGARSNGTRRQFRGNFDPSKTDTTKMTPEMLARMHEFQARRARQKAVSDSAGMEATPHWVLVKEKDKITPRQVLAGISNLDNTVILSGLADGEEVIAQPTSMLAKDREQMMQRFRSFGGIPGMGGGGGTRR